MKVRKIVTDKGVVTKTDYLGEFQYVKGKLSFFPTSEGFFNAETNVYVYQFKDHLGNVRLSYSDKSKNNTIEASEIIEETNYYPFGLAHKGYNQKNDALMKDYKYQYNGKEKQEELGLNYYDYGARNYDAAIGRWMNVDPLAEKYMSFTPYAYVGNNPLNAIDPDGMRINPIYGEEGEFLGTDDKGLQGAAIIMNTNNFKQGMSNEEALSNSLGSEGLKDEKAVERMNNHYKGLKNRPDYDGVLTLSEANDWYRNGEGKPLYVDSAKISLLPQVKENFKVGESKYVNFASPSNANLETGLVYGTIKLTLLDSNGTTKLGGNGNKLDTYDFDYKKGRTGRNIATFLGEAVAGKGKGFDIYTYGKARLQSKPIKAPAKNKFERGPKF
ncbi:RHS repeat-associated core domain-containing protein [Myroides sp. M-43]|uniref:RHS repeat domain-containing protein n=1 Tax=Myroides oncorhynchi TaxID=2893756 RepID=UPI001E59CEAB|nr:RHS repeat-associated core domain-containing protein [Myroides oncorhynchi]MCC9041165.1 RHS repeat-associated core domain-containing protein [Myroides oncorhynchi]